MSDRVLFHMDRLFRVHLIERHKFYVEQAQMRLLSQFEDISGEADMFADQWLTDHDHLFDPERHDPGDFEERAYDESIGFYGLLTEMHENTRLGVIAGMYHEWDKQLREWIARELGHTFAGKHTKDAIWKGDFGKIFDLLECLGWPVRSQACFAQLDQCRLVVNVYKHGLGNSFTELKEHHPQFLHDVFEGSLGAKTRGRYLDHTNLKVTDLHLSAFADAVTAFWQDVPDTVLRSQVTGTPKWLLKAMEKDAEAALPKR